MNRKNKSRTQKNKTNDAIQTAIEYGIDITLLYEALSLTPTERLEQHQNMLEFVEELKRARAKKYGKS